MITSRWGSIHFTAQAVFRLGDERHQISLTPEGDTHLDRTFAGAGRGQLRTSQQQHAGVLIQSELFTTDGAVTAIRVGLTNRSDRRLELEQLLPVVVDRDGISLAGVPASEWVLLRQPRMKNDLPACVRLGSAGEEVWDAVRGTPETGGVPQPAQAGALPPTRFVCSELAVLGTGATVTEKGALALGFVPITDYLVSTQVTLSEDRRALQSLSMACEGDGQVVQPGAEVWSQWAVLIFAPSVADAICRYADLLRAHSPCRETADVRAPTVWCSWYYYGDGFTQDELEANLAWLEEHPLPIDVLQIDECWDRRWGEWLPNDRWPDLGRAAERIRALGCRPGIWTCGFLAEPRATIRYHKPGWLLRDRQGDEIRFPMNGMQNAVLDPTHPEVLAFLEETYRRLTETYGFTYHKVDFTRAVAHPDAVFHDRSKNRAQAFRMGIAAIRRGIGQDAYLNICGGLYGPSLGLADGQRTGSDTKGTWPAHPEGDPQRPFGPFTIKQNTLRFWMNRLWQNDPDAAMIRRRSESYRGEKLSIGTMNDTEAETTVLNQYLAGGIVCFTENLPEIDADRLLLYRRCVPTIGQAAVPRDLRDGHRFPALFDTEVVPCTSELATWHTVSVVNWHGVPRSFRLSLRELLSDRYLASADRFLVSTCGRPWHRVLPAEGAFTIENLPPHGCEVIKVQPYRPEQPHLLRTDGHFSMGGVEIDAWTVDGEQLSIEGIWPWPCPLALAVLLPGGEGAQVSRLRVPGTSPGERGGRFALRLELGRPASG